MGIAAPRPKLTVLRTLALALSALNVIWIVLLALARDRVASAFPHLNDPFASWPVWYMAIPAIVGALTAVLCVRAGRPRDGDEGWNGATTVGLFFSSMAALGWVIILLAQVAPTS